LGSKRSIKIVEPPIGLLPSLRALASQLFAKVFSNERVRIETPRITRIFPGEEACSP
jgi:hypothetical protein